MMLVAGQVAVILVLAVAVALSVNHLRPGRLPLVADWSPEAQLVTGSGESLAISIEEAEMLFFTGEAVFLDARPRDRYAEGHIEGAVNLPWEEFDQVQEEVLAELPPDARLIAYCDGEGCASSKELALSLLVKGYGQVKVLVNGWSVWQQRGLPVEESLEAHAASQ